MRPCERCPGRRGSVLVAVLVVLALAAAMLWLIQASAFAKAQSVRQQTRTLSSDALFLEGLREAMQRLADDEDLLVDHPSEVWAMPFEIALPGGGALEIAIHDENSLFDLNNAPVVQEDDSQRPVSEILNDLFRLCGITSNTTDLVGALIDETDANNAGSFEDPEQFGPANAPLTTWRDMLGVPGADPNVFLAPLPDPDRERDLGEPEHPRHVFTILPSPISGNSQTNQTEGADTAERRNATRVNLNTAPAPVLRGIIGNTAQRAALVEQFLAFRKETPIRSINAYLDRLPPADIAIAQAYLDTKSTHFTITIQAVDTDREGPSYASALVERDSQGMVKVLHWHP